MNTFEHLVFVIRFSLEQISWDISFQILTGTDIVGYFVLPLLHMLQMLECSFIHEDKTTMA